MSRSQKQQSPKGSLPALAPEPPKPAPQPYSVADRAVIGLLFFWTFVSLIFPLYDTDFWWHLRTGELILRDGKPPQVDWFTFTEFDKPWIDLHWGFQVLITVLYRVGGVNLIILAKAAIITGAVAIAWCATGRTLPVWLRAAVWVPAIIAISGRAYERPEMLSLLFLALWLWIVFRAEERPRLIWWLPAIQLVWVNCHALFVLGLVVGGCFVADLVVRDIAQGGWGLDRPSQQTSGRTIIRAGALTVLACFINPYFEEGVLFPLTLYRKFTVDQEFYSVRIGEFHQPIQFVMQYGWAGVRNPYLLAEASLWCLAAGSFVWLFAHRRWSVFRLLLFVGFSHLAWEATRNTNIFSLVAGTLLCANLSEIPAARLKATSANRPARSLTVAAVLAGLIGFVVTGTWNRIGEGNKPFRLGEHPSWFIHEAAKFAGQDGFPDRAFVSHNGQAAVYEYHNGPGRLVFFDGRLEVCTKETFQAFENIIQAMSVGNRSWEKLFEGKEAGLPVVILSTYDNASRGAINGLLNTPGWRLVFADPTAAVFLDNQTADRLKREAVDPRQLLPPTEGEHKTSNTQSNRSAPP